jgi:hypothetical protein
MKKIIITRTDYSDKQTLGVGMIVDNGRPIFEFKTLELPWKNNQSKVSCIPSGKYTAFKRISGTPGRGQVFQLEDVPNRIAIQIHSGNYYTDILGCILVGTQHTDINNDGYADVINSKKVLNSILDLLSENVQVEIIGNSVIEK